MGPAFIFQISDLNKKFGQRELLKNINLAFYPGAKIGLLGAPARMRGRIISIAARSGSAAMISARRCCTSGSAAGRCLLTLHPPRPAHALRASACRLGRRALGAGRYPVGRLRTTGRRLVGVAGVRAARVPMSVRTALPVFGGWAHQPV